MKDLYKKIKPYLVYLYAIIAGGLMPFAFSPYDWGLLGIVSPAILIWLLTKRSPKLAFLIGFCYGIGMFGLGVNWVYVSIHDYGYTSQTLAAFITTLFILFLSLYPAAMAALLNKYFPRNDIARCILAYPSFWVLFEMLRGWFLTGFPWLFVGYTQLGSALHGFAPIGGVWMVSWFSICTAGTLSLIVEYYYLSKDNNKLRNRFFIIFISIWAAAFGASKYKWILPSDNGLEVALVQGNVPQLMRWDPVYVKNIVDTYSALTDQITTANVVVWPEGAIPIPLPLSQPFFQQLNQSFSARNVALFSGLPTQLEDQTHYYNSLIGVGAAKGTYYKSHLVPFGEYVPFESLLRGMIAFLNLPMSSFVSGPSHQPLLTAFEYQFAPAICYEIAYPFYIQQISKKADFILTVSNDTWFGTSIGPYQHLQIAQFRALETGKYVIRATNSGITAILNPDNQVTETEVAKSFEATVFTGQVFQMYGQTWWVKFGVLTLLVLLPLPLIGAFYIRSKYKV